MSQTTARLSDAAGEPVPALAGMAAAPAPVSRPPPGRASAGPIGWARQNLFSSIASTIATVVLAGLLLYGAMGFFRWAVLNAVWSVPHQGAVADASACRAVQGRGACWAVVSENYRLILFGRYPFEEQWRPAIVIVLFIGLYVVSAMRRFWRTELIYLWVATLAVIGLLMWGGLPGLPYVREDSWGGLPITLILATFGLALAFPLALFVALGRRSLALPAVRTLSVLYVELIRGVPLITLLFMASVMFPLFMPPGFNLNGLLRAQLAVILFAAAYLAEVVRGGLQALPKGQAEAADALGLTYWKKTRLIVLPQALRLVIPPLVNTFIGFFKDTSLVLIIGIFDFLAAGKLVLADPAWQAYSTEIYILLALVYFVFCYVMARYSRGIERELGRSVRR